MVFDTLAAFEEARDNRYDSGNLFYCRYGNTASFELERTLCSLEQAQGITLTSSGVAAISLTLMALLEPGKHLLVADNVYSNTRGFCDKVLTRHNITVEYFDPAIGADISKLIQATTAAIMFEAPGSGTFEFPDITSIAGAAKAAGIRTVLDSTWLTPVFCQPLALGVDVVVYSASKYLGGHSDCMMGVIATSDSELNNAIRTEVLTYGDKVGSQEVFLTMRGLRPLNMRMQLVDTAGRNMAQWFDQQPQVKQVLHPALPDSPGHAHWRDQCSGAAGLFGVIFKPCGDNQIRQFVDALHHFGIGVSWGGYESLVLPVTPIRTAQTWQESGQLVRFNIGFEKLDDLKSDLSAALAHLNS